MTERVRGDGVLEFFGSEVQRAVARHPRQTAEIVATLSRPVREDDDVEDALRVVVDLAVRTIGPADQASATFEHVGNGLTAVHTDEGSPSGERRCEREDSPHLAAVRTREVVLVHVDAAHARGAGVAGEVGPAAAVTSVLAAPIGVRGAASGALSLYGTGEPRLDRGDVVLLRVLAEMATRFLDELVTAQTTGDEVARLRERSARRASSGSGAGTPPADHELDDLRVFALLRAQSQRVATAKQAAAATRHD